MLRSGFVTGEITGLGLRTMDLRVLVELPRARSGRTSYGELSRRLRFGRVPFTGASYMGYAVRVAR